MFPQRIYHEIPKHCIRTHLIDGKSQTPAQKKPSAATDAKHRKTVSALYDATIALMLEPFTVHDICAAVNQERPRHIDEISYGACKAAIQEREARGMVKRVHSEHSKRASFIYVGGCHDVK